MYPTTLFVFLAILPMVTFIEAKIECGKQAEEPSITFAKDKVTPNEAVKAHSWPWQAFLQIGSGDEVGSSCGAILLPVEGNDEESDILVTAAHCVTTEESSKTFEPEQYDPKTVELIAALGAHDLLHHAEGQRNIRVAEIRKHPGFNQSTRNDIALLRLTHPVLFGKTISPVCLPKEGEDLPTALPCAVAGWAGNDGTLKQLGVPVHPAATCAKNKFGALLGGMMGEASTWGNKYEESEMVCAGPLEATPGVCNSASGGMLACKRTDNSFALYGVASFTKDKCVAAGYPPIFARVSSYVDWIKETSKDLSSVKPIITLQPAVLSKLKPRK